MHSKLLLLPFQRFYYFPAEYMSYSNTIATSGVYCYRWMLNEENPGGFVLLFFKRIIIMPEGIAQEMYIRPTASKILYFLLCSNPTSYSSIFWITTTIIIIIPQGNLSPEVSSFFPLWKPIQTIELWSKLMIKANKTAEDVNNKGHIDKPRKMLASYKYMYSLLCIIHYGRFK